MPVNQFSPKDRARYETSANRLIAKFDANNNGTVDQRETTKSGGKDYWTYTNRIGSSDFVTRTTIYYDTFSGIKDAEFRLADANRDNKLTKEEVLQSFLETIDSNKDGKLSFFERLGDSVNGHYEKSWKVETDRQSRLEYDPLPRDYDRPTPPSSGSDPYRPSPPSSGSDPYRPSPPSSGSDPYRPSPPSSGNSRPTPPSSGSNRPTPPGL